MSRISAIELNKVCYSYRSDWIFQRVKVLKDISLSISDGEIFGFLGHNGAGKTTTIKCILGLCSPSSGDISIYNRNISKHDTRSDIGYLPEQPYFYDYITVTESLTAYGRLSGVHKSEINDRIEELCLLLGLEEKRNTKMRNLSKGLMQRVGMAQAIINRPRLLILDEPFSGLDPVGRRDFRELIRKLKGDGTTILMSSHVLSDVEALCDRASILVKGELKGIYSMRELTNETPTKFEISIEHNQRSKEYCELYRRSNQSSSTSETDSQITFSVSTYSEAHKIVQEVLALDIKLIQFTSERNNLEDIFVSVVTGQGG